MRSPGPTAAWSSWTVMLATLLEDLGLISECFECDVDCVARRLRRRLILSDEREALAKGVELLHGVVEE
jgi:hypothetical protein